MDYVRLIREYGKPHARFAVIVLVAQFVSVLAQLLLPRQSADIINNGVIPGDIEHIWHTSGWMLGTSVLQLVAAVVTAYAAARFAMGFGADLRSAIFERTLTFSAREIRRFGAATLITRCTNDVQQMQRTLLMASMLLVAAPLTLVGGIGMAVRENLQLSWLVAVMLPVLVIFLGISIGFMVPLFRKMQTSIDTVNQVLREQLSGLQVIRAFVREPKERRRFDQANGQLADLQLGVGNIMVIVFPAVSLIMNISAVAVIWFGGKLVAAGDMQVGSLLAYISYLVQILMAVMFATLVSSMVPRAAVSASRATEVLKTDTSVVVPAKPVPTSGLNPARIEARDVSFRYPGAEKPVLSGISFVANPGEMTAIIGSTGSGKTTLVNLLPRLADPTAGSVLLDGVDAKDLAPHDLWRSVGLVPQKAFLFSGTIASNLRYGRPRATDDELWEALRVAQAENFVRDLELGLEAPVSQGGSNFSGGQKQRLCIARALVAKPSIYIFDDSFSALDVATDAALRAALRPVTKDAAVIVVAQRVATIRAADQIVVLEAGNVVGLGTHDELLRSCAAYQEIVQTQQQQEAA